MKAKNQEIVMPEKSRAMTQEEMEYEGGFLNFVIGAVCSVASVGCSIMATIDKKNSSAWNVASYGLSAVSVVCTLGVGTAVFSVAKHGSNSALVSIASSKIAGTAGKMVVSGRMTADTYRGYKMAYSAGITAPCFVSRACSKLSR